MQAVTLLLCTLRQSTGGHGWPGCVSGCLEDSSRGRHRRVGDYAQSRAPEVTGALLLQFRIILK